MLKRIALMACAAAAIAGCSKKEAGAGASSAPSSSAAVAVPAAGSVAASSRSAVPAAGGLTHLASKTPPPANDECAQLPKGADSKWRQLAVAVRRLACEPALFYEPVDTLRKELALPEGFKLEFNGAASVIIEFSDPPKATEFAKVLGVETPMGRQSTRGAWQRRIWFLGSNADDGAFDLWGPGKVLFDVDVDYMKMPGKEMVTPIKDEDLGNHVIVNMEATVPIQDDEAAVRMLAAGIEAVGKDPSLKNKDLATLAKSAGFDNERFRVSERTISGTRSGVDVWTRRTRIGAEAVIRALGLKGKIEHRRARDADDYLLYDGSSTHHTYKGESFELSFKRREGGGEGNAGYVLSGITL